MAEVVVYKDEAYYPVGEYIKGLDFLDNCRTEITFCSRNKKKTDLLVGVGIARYKAEEMPYIGRPGHVTLTDIKVICFEDSRIHIIICSGDYCLVINEENNTLLVNYGENGNRYWFNRAL